MSPHGTEHAVAIGLVQEALSRAFGDAYCVRVQLPLAVSDQSEPEPDLAVVAGSPRDYLDEHPTTALLVVEVSDTTLAHDSTRKVGLYASAGIQEYWIVNLREHRVEALAEPTPDPGADFGFKYNAQRAYGIGEIIAPLARPDAGVRVTDLLP